MQEVHPFTLRTHSKHVIEMIVDDPLITGVYKSLYALDLLSKRFEHVILSIDKSTALDFSISQTLDLFNETSFFGPLKIVRPGEQQMPFELKKTRSFSSLDQALKRIDGEVNARRALKTMSQLAPLNTSAHRLMPMLNNPSTPFSEIEEIASRDPSLVASMLRRANSAAFARLQKVEDLKSVVAYLGIEGIKQILSLEVFNGFTKAFSAQRERLAHMRRASVLCSELAKMTFQDKAIVQKIRLMGLMHDLGSLALAFYDKDGYGQVINHTRNDKKLSFEAEIDIFGIDHQELGAVFAKQIGMPDYVIEASLRHHDTHSQPNDLELAILVVVNGFLNHKIENTPYTLYDNHLGLVVQYINNELEKKGVQAKKEVINKLNVARTIANKQSNSSAPPALITTEPTAFKITPVNVLELLKKELDDYMIKDGADAQGI